MGQTTAGDESVSTGKMTTAICLSEYLDKISTQNNIYIYIHVKGVFPTCLRASVPSSGITKYQFENQLPMISYLPGSSVCSSFVVDVDEE